MKKFLVVFGDKKVGFRNKVIEGYDVYAVLTFLKRHDYDIKDIFSITRLD